MKNIIILKSGNIRNKKHYKKKVLKDEVLRFEKKSIKKIKYWEEKILKEKYYQRQILEENDI